MARTDLAGADHGVGEAMGIRTVLSRRATLSPHHHEVACAEHWAPRLEAVMRDAGAHTSFWVISPPMPGTLFEAVNPTPDL